MFAKFRDVFIPVWGVSYLIAFIVRPGLIGNLPIWASSIALLSMFSIITVNFFILDLDILWYLLSVRAIFGMITSWSGVTAWNVPYDPGAAAISMAFLDLIAALAFYSKAMPSIED